MSDQTDTIATLQSQLDRQNALIDRLVEANKPGQLRQVYRAIKALAASREAGE